MKSNYGVVSGIIEGAKIKGPIYLKDAIFLMVVWGITIALGQGFPENQALSQYAFYGLGILLGIYLDLHPASNPGKRNYQLVMTGIMNRQPKIFRSFGYYEFKPLSQMRKEWHTEW